MMAAYASGDPYLAFATQAGAVPASATRQTHPAIREQFKACALAVQYGMGDVSLGHRVGQPPSQARELLTLHRRTYRTFWDWSDACLDYAHLHGSLYTTFGWTLHLGPQVNPRSLRNFPMQANGAEMLRLACCFATERGIRVCAPVHDALLIEAPLDDLESAVVATQGRDGGRESSCARRLFAARRGLARPVSRPLHRPERPAHVGHRVGHGGGTEQSGKDRRQGGVKPILS